MDEPREGRVFIGNLHPLYRVFMTGHIAHVVGLVLDHLMTTPNYFQLHYPCLLWPQANQRVSHHRVLLPTSELMRPAERALRNPSQSTCPQHVSRSRLCVHHSRRPCALPAMSPCRMAHEMKRVPWAEAYSRSPHSGWDPMVGLGIANQCNPRGCRFRLHSLVVSDVL